MLFKYKTELTATGSNCPGVDAVELDSPKIAFRLVSNEILTDQDFVPPSIMNKGIHRGRASCEGYALSFFETSEQACAHYCRLKTKLANQQREIRLGPYVAKCELESCHGLCTPVRKADGHFDLHEYENATVEQKSLTLGMINCG
jgi:hypothetical protein